MKFYAIFNTQLCMKHISHSKTLTWWSKGILIDWLIDGLIIMGVRLRLWTAATGWHRKEYTNSLWWSWRWGENTTLKCGHQRANFSSPRWCMSMESHGGMITTGENSRFVHQIYLGNLPTEASSCKSGDTQRRKWLIWPCKYLCSSF
jgi:hypothetical protein